MFRFFKGSRSRSVQALDTRETIQRDASTKPGAATSPAPPGSFGDLLWHYRTKEGRSQAEFAKHSGIPLYVLTALEEGKQAGDDKTVQRIAVALFLSRDQEEALTTAWAALQKSGPEPRLRP